MRISERNEFGPVSSAAKLTPVEHKCCQQDTRASQASRDYYEIVSYQEDGDVSEPGAPRDHRQGTGILYPPADIFYRRLATAHRFIEAEALHPEAVVIHREGIARDGTTAAGLFMGSVRGIDRVFLQPSKGAARKLEIYHDILQALQAGRSDTLGRLGKNIEQGDLDRLGELGTLIQEGKLQDVSPFRIMSDDRIIVTKETYGPNNWAEYSFSNTVVMHEAGIPYEQTVAVMGIREPRNQFNSWKKNDDRRRVEDYIQTQAHVMGLYKMYQELGLKAVVPLTVEMFVDRDHETFQEMLNAADINLTTTSNQFNKEHINAVTHFGEADPDVFPSYYRNIVEPVIAQGAHRVPAPQAPDELIYTTAQERDQLAQIAVPRYVAWARHAEMTLAEYGYRNAFNEELLRLLEIEVTSVGGDLMSEAEFEAFLDKQAKQALRSIRALYQNN